MGKAKDIAEAKARMLRGKMKESDGIALGNERLKKEGRAEQAEARKKVAEARRGTAQPSE